MHCYLTFQPPILDSATLQLLFTDLGSDFSLVSREQALAVRAPAQWVDEYVRRVLLTEHRLQVWLGPAPGQIKRARAN